MQHDRPIGYFVHHHGRGHARRFLAIAHQLEPHPVTAFCALPGLLESAGPNVEVVPLPNFHRQPSATAALHRLPIAEGLDCAPVGVSEIRRSMSRIASWLGEADPVLLVSDVSAEVALLGRICSVPVIKIRMHGNRSDRAHRAAYSSAAGMLAPFDESLEQPDWPACFRSRTCYTGGLLGVQPGEVPDKLTARRKLDLPEARHIILAISGWGGAGTSYASLTMGARAVPDALWLCLGNSQRLGHETDFANLESRGWVDQVADYIAAADVIIANPGDTLVHEVARIGRPLVCVPEWCYYDEQRYKARMLQQVGAGVCCETWPASFEHWQQVLGEAQALDLNVQRALVNPSAAAVAARYLLEMSRSLWQGAGCAPAACTRPEAV